MCYHMRLMASGPECRLPKQFDIWLQGAISMAERLPSCLLEKAFSKSLDVLSPLAAVERSPSQLLENALSLPRAATLDMVLERFGSHRL